MQADGGDGLRGERGQYCRSEEIGLYQDGCKQHCTFSLCPRESWWGGKAKAYTGSDYEGKDETCGNEQEARTFENCGDIM